MDGNVTEWLEWKYVDFSFLRNVKYAKRDRGNQRLKKLRNIKNILCAWDIETSVLPGEEQSYVYHWQFQLGFDMPTIYGRTIEEFRLCLDRIEPMLEKDETLLIFVHNLSYEWCWLRGIYPDITDRDIFCTAPRKPVKVKIHGGKIEFRCSYILTNLSLSAWTTKYNVEHKKCSADEYDHTKVRYPWSDLTPEELDYCRNDVLGLIEALKIHLEINERTLATVCLTSTGFVREDVKRVMRNWSWRGLQAVQPTPEVYIALREAFRGGDVHCNRYYSGCIINDVGSADRSSSYPDVCVNRLFPMGKFIRSWEMSISHLNNLIRMGRAVLVRLRFEGVYLKNPYDPCPYLSYSKIIDPVENRKKSEFLKTFVLDNGRILSGECGIMTVTDIDYKIIKKHYNFKKLVVLDMWDTRYDYLPDMLRALIISYYTDKTRLKNVEGEELMYEKQKARLNSIYGLLAQDVCKPHVVYHPEAETNSDVELFQVEEGDIIKLLEKSCSEPYASYQWGVWVTALAREELHRVIDYITDQREAGKDVDFLYCDTDSVKYTGEIDLSWYNEEKIKNSTENGAFATDPNGVQHFMGVFEDEGRYARFISHGCKKYAFIKPDKSGSPKIGLTVAGVSKKYGAEELTENGGLEAFKPGFVFSRGGGVEAVYNDFTTMCLDIDGHKLNIGPNVCLVPSTYKLGLADDYIRLLENIELLRRLEHEKILELTLCQKS